MRLGGASGAASECAGADSSGDRPRRVIMEPGGPLLVEGPVEVVQEDGTTVVCDRFMVALCTCRRSREEMSSYVRRYVVPAICRPSTTETPRR